MSKKYNPKYPYRINGQQVNADNVGVAYPGVWPDQIALEVTCTTEGIILELGDQKALLDQGHLRDILDARANK